MRRTSHMQHVNNNRTILIKLSSPLILQVHLVKKSKLHKLFHQSLWNISSFI